MRTIKFRAWDTTNKRWCKPFGMPFDELAFKDGGAIIPYRDRVLMQYTGLKDKNGVEIYHSDILRNPETNQMFEVPWWPEFGDFRAQIRKGHLSSLKLDVPVPLYVVAEACEVIGNIHANPELLPPPNTERNGKV